ncbi:unnamed protein product [Trypanosoma congolense IL3000]|uniref:WGS project CAEQ00000000 data, annotated contig 359 n=1 Tax=Trypanosoma congolense (strain IL3000) TaxID=1068625 RepID=F9WF78_TRYCI|nr:unnamed protein product [Trypanosoma congolense IL3000]
MFFFIISSSQPCFRIPLAVDLLTFFITFRLCAFLWFLLSRFSFLFFSFSISLNSALPPYFDHFVPPYSSPYQAHNSWKRKTKELTHPLPSLPFLSPSHVPLSMQVPRLLVASRGTSRSCVFDEGLSGNRLLVRYAYKQLKRVERGKPPLFSFVSISYESLQEGPHRSKGQIRKSSE